MPIVRPIYRTMKQIFETLFAKSGSSFRKVALVEFPVGMYSVVFLSQPPAADIAERAAGRGRIRVLLPAVHAQPDDGLLFLRQARHIIELDISVQAAMTLIMSAGMVQPGAEAQKRLAALADASRVSAASATKPAVP